MQNKKKILKVAFEAIFFAVVLGLTCYVVFNGQDLGSVFEAISDLNPIYLPIGILFALSFIACEGYMIWTMISRQPSLKALSRCMGYSFVNFFYSSITPGASGGQPMQLFMMSRDGYSFSRSCAALTVIAVSNKFVLAFSGILLLIFWHKPLTIEFGEFMWWYYLGLAMLIAIIIILFLLMFAPNFLEKHAKGVTNYLARHKLVKETNLDIYNTKITTFFDGYRNIIGELESHKNRVILIIFISFLQRALLVGLTYLVYIGFGLTGTGFIPIFLGQLSINIAVDMIPLPGAQGISEFLYKHVFASIFVGQYLTASMCITRLTSFYFLLILSMIVVIVKSISSMNSQHKEEDA